MACLKESNYLCFNQKLLCSANERRDEGKSQVYSTESLNLPKYIFLVGSEDLFWIEH